MRFGYFLPITRQCTRSQARYVKEWRELGSAVTEILGGRLVAYDPDLLLQFDDGQTVQIPAWIAVKLREWKAQHDDAHAPRGNSGRGLKHDPRTG